MLYDMCSTSCWHSVQEGGDTMIYETDPDTDENGDEEEEENEE